MATDSMNTTDTPDTTRLSEETLTLYRKHLRLTEDGHYDHGFRIRTLFAHIDTLTADLARVEADNARLRDFLQLIVEEVDKGRAVNVRGVAVHALHNAADVPREQE